MNEMPTEPGLLQRQAARTFPAIVQIFFFCFALYYEAVCAPGR